MRVNSVRRWVVIIRRAAARLSLGLCVATGALADEPLWEIGAGVGAASFPEYRGSNERSGFVVPIPYIAYRGERFKVDREGARGLLANTPQYEIDLSVDGAVPVESSKDGPRAGMEELDPVVELGPSFDWRLGQSERGRWTLRLPLRAAIATDIQSTSQVGWTFSPMVRFRSPRFAGAWDFRFDAGPVFGSRDFHAYYYDVGAGDVRPGRERFRAPAGYSGLSLRLGSARRFGRIWVGGFMRYDNLAGAAFEDSPLVETRHALSAGFGISWVFRQSRERAGRAESDTVSMGSETRAERQ